MKISLLSEMKGDAREFFRTFLSVFKTSRRAIVLFLILVSLLALMLHPYDHSFNRTMVKSQTESLARLGDSFRYWGDFRDTVTVTLLLLIAGRIARRREWRKLAVAFFLAVCLSGITVNVLRFTTGRPRPHMQRVTEDRFYGPIFLQPRSERPGQAKFRSFQSFPSGHCGTSVAAAAMLLVAAPAVGIPMVISAAGIVWSSVYGSSHYLSDVTVGSGIGLIFGSVGGLVYRRMRAKAIIESAEA